MAVQVLTRRQLLGFIGGLPIAAGVVRRAWTQTHARVVVIGGGFGGATCAKYIRRADAAIEVTLVEPRRQFITCPFSNAVIAGLRDMASVTHGYDDSASAPWRARRPCQRDGDRSDGASRHARRRQRAGIRSVGALTGYRLALGGDRGLRYSGQ